MSRPMHFTAGGKWHNHVTRYTRWQSAGTSHCANLKDFDGTVDPAKVTCKRCLAFLGRWRRADEGQGS